MQRDWVLIRGIMSESFHWWDFLPLLQQAFPNDVFHNVDILGNGQNNHLYTPLSIKKNIEGLREQLSNHSPKIVLGFSLGGMLALEWAHHFPNEIEQVILLNSSLNNSKVYDRITPFSLKEIFKSSLQKNMTDREKVILRMTTTLPENEISIIAEKWGNRAAEVPVKSINFINQLILASQIRQRATPPCKVTILAAANDKVVNPHCSKIISNKWNLPLHLHPDAGHDLTLEDPQWVLDHIKSAVKK